MWADGRQDEVAALVGLGFSVKSFGFAGIEGDAFLMTGPRLNLSCLPHYRAES